MDDLFDFSGGAETIATSSKHRRREANDKPSSSSKPPNPSTQTDEEMKDGDVEDVSDEEEYVNAPGPSGRPRKRARKHEPAPVVLDEFETQAKRELPVNAGLGATTEVDGQSLLLTHQVSQFAGNITQYHLTPTLPGSTSSRCPFQL